MSVYYYILITISGALTGSDVMIASSHEGLTGEVNNYVLCAFSFNLYPKPTEQKLFYFGFRSGRTAQTGSEMGHPQVTRLITLCASPSTSRCVKTPSPSLLGTQEVTLSTYKHGKHKICTYKPGQLIRAELSATELAINTMSTS